jgi:hypothetical protein
MRNSIGQVRLLIFPGKISQTKIFFSDRCYNQLELENTNELGAATLPITVATNPIRKLNWITFVTKLLNINLLISLEAMLKLNELKNMNQQFYATVGDFVNRIKDK